MTDLLEQTRSILKTLIGFPTVSSDSNLALIDWVEAYLSPLGARFDVTRDQSGAKANLFASIGPDVDGGVVLSGHTDVVPVDGQAWSRDAFEAWETDEAGGRTYGRGACDMKGFLACMLAMAPRFAEARLDRPIHLAFTYDEETGCLGARVMLDALEASGRRPRACIIGEPTEMRIIEGHKGCCEYRTVFTGLEGHSANPDICVNALEYAVRYAAELMATAKDLKDRAPGDSRFEPPWTTLTLGVMEGGTAHNVVPNHAALAWSMRPVTMADQSWVKNRIRTYAEEVLAPEMKAVDPKSGIRTETIGEVEGLEPMADSEALALAVALTGGNERGVVPFGTEAGIFQSIGVPAVVCGPGSIAQAHKPDEYVDHDQLRQCLAMLGRLIP